MFKIYSYKAFKFERKESGQVVEKVDVQPMTFNTVPNWVRKTALYKWATDDGSIVEAKAADQQNTEPSELDQLKERARELKVKSYGNMGIPRLKEAIAEAEAALESGGSDGGEGEGGEGDGEGSTNQDNK